MSGIYRGNLAIERPHGRQVFLCQRRYGHDRVVETNRRQHIEPRGRFLGRATQIQLIVIGQRRSGRVQIKRDIGHDRAAAAFPPPPDPMKR